MESRNAEYIVDEFKRPRGRPVGSYKENKITNKQYFRDYYHKTCEKIICECGLKTNKRNLARHLKSKIHQQLMETKKI